MCVTHTKATGLLAEKRFEAVESERVAEEGIYLGFAASNLADFVSAKLLKRESGFWRSRTHI